MATNYLVFPAQGFSVVLLHLDPAQGLSLSLLTHLRFPAQGFPAQGFSDFRSRFLPAQGFAPEQGALAALDGASAAIAAPAIGTVNRAIANAETNVLIFFPERSIYQLLDDFLN